ncbi:MAG: hypothetical protein KC589_09830 [Nanoarchaeota archaeon]|nr:hypothetical protein [Nanoarchaeota archaeon]
MNSYIESRLSFPEWANVGRVITVIANEFKGFGTIEIVKIPKTELYPEGIACLDINKNCVLPYEKFKEAKVISVWANMEAYIDDLKENCEEEE